MRIKLNTSIAGRGISGHHGDEIDIDAETAKRLIQSGQAEKITRRGKAPEKAVAGKPPETAVAP